LVSSREGGGGGGGCSLKRGWAGILANKIFTLFSPLKVTINKCWVFVRYMPHNLFWLVKILLEIKDILSSYSFSICPSSPLLQCNNRVSTVSLSQSDWDSDLKCLLYFLTYKSSHQQIVIVSCPPTLCWKVEALKTNWTKQNKKKQGEHCFSTGKSIISHIDWGKRHDWEGDMWCCIVNLHILLCVFE